MNNIHYTSCTENVGKLRCHTTFPEKKGDFSTDVATSIGGLGEYPSPSAMLAASVASCMLSMISFKGQAKGVKAEGIRILAAAENGTNGISALCFDIHVPNCPLELRSLLEASALACPVAKTIRPDIEKRIRWHWL